MKSLAENKIEVAQCSGFCFGVKRAMRIAKEALDKNKDAGVYSLGPIIHNNQVVEELTKEGLKPASLDDIKKGVVVISSHGAAPKVFSQIKAKGLRVVDATCPYVMSTQKTVEALSKDGYFIVIFGDRRHPEVESLMGFSGGTAAVVKDEKELGTIEFPHKKIGIVSQTTQLPANYIKVISAVMEKGFSEIRIFNTICSDTQKRQESAAALAKDSDVIVIIGGKMSANTKRLFEICSNICKGTYHIETADELKKAWFKGAGRIGIASGASTPDWVIEEVKNKILMIKEEGMGNG
ncbi:MAG: 4-hydroxy-3-methylbut-2-enyl diphosphate reductase [Candidatus Omnitrophica bacterium]|nr:4-hydroxy-3-methylbut-2-enyl diphosphate reductase [Candidatus Omnitrophota bacterium]